MLLAAGVAYLSLGQRSFYGVDGWMLARRVIAGDIRSEMHLLYKPLAALAVAVGEGVGLTAYESMVVLSGVGSAIGVAAIHAALRTLGASRRDALLGTAVAAAMPGVVFYATVIERHGPFFAFAGLCALAAARLTQRCTGLLAFVFGLACALAYAAHSTGVLMLAGFLPLAAALAREHEPALRWSSFIRPAVFAALTTAAGMFIARRIGIALGTVQHEGDNFAFFLQHAAVHVTQPAALPACLWNEILTAFAPMSLLWLVAFSTRSRWPVGAAVAVAIALYFLFSFLILGSFDERGAYALPLAWPFAVVAWRFLRTPFTLLVVVASALLAVGEVRSHDDRPLAARAAGMYEAAGERQPYLLAMAPEDFELLFLYQPAARAPAGFFDAFDTHGFAADVVREHAPTLVAFLAERRASGRELLLSEVGLAAMRLPADDGRAGPLLVAMLETGFRFEPVERGGFRGYRLLPRG